MKIKFLLILFFTYLAMHSFMQAEDSSTYSSKLNNFYKKLNTSNFNTYQQLDVVDNLISQTKNDSILADLYLAKSKIHHLIGEYPKASFAVNKALEYYNSKNNLNKIGTCYIDLGEIYRAASSFNSSIDYLNKAVDIFKASNDSNSLSRAYNRIAAVYFQDNRQSDLSKKYCRLSLDYALKDKVGSEIKANTYNILGAVYSFSDKDKSIQYFNHSLAISDSLKLTVDQPNIYINIANLMYDNGDYLNALESARTAFRIAITNGVNSYFPQSLNLISKSLYKLQQFDSAYQYLQLTKDFSDSLINEKKNQQLIEMRTKYELSTSEKQIESQKMLRIYQAIAFGVIIVVVFLLALTTLFRYKSEKTKNKELGRMNKVISTQNSQLGELNATKDKFFSIIAHDLKNPLSTIKLIAHSLSEEMIELNENEKIELVGEIKKSTVLISNLLDNLLIWARSQTGKIVYQPVSFNFHMLAQSNINLLAKQAKVKNISLSNEIDDIVIFADPNMLNTVLRNVITNAIKFTPEYGNVKIFNNAINNDQIEELIVTIEDNGVGMDSKTKSKMFKIDSSQSMPGTNNEKGTGLGLIICKEFIDLHNGRIWVESEFGKGTKVRFSLPRAAVGE